MQNYIEKSSSIEKDYYSFKEYNSKIRMLTYWHQIDEVISVNPQSVLEIGKGTGLVYSYLSCLGIDVKTFDVNADLKPDIVGNIEHIDDVFEPNSWDVVLCSRVLHHIPFSNFYSIIQKLTQVASQRLVVSVPVDDLRIYNGLRYTSGRQKTLSIGLPLGFKRLLGKAAGKPIGSGLWQLNSQRETRITKVISDLNDLGLNPRTYRMEEDRSHMFLIFDL
jgi:hypothetical protein